MELHHYRYPALISCSCCASSFSELAGHRGYPWSYDNLRYVYELGVDLGNLHTNRKWEGYERSQPHAEAHTFFPQSIALVFFKDSVSLRIPLGAEKLGTSRLEDRYHGIHEERRRNNTGSFAETSRGKE